MKLERRKRRPSQFRRKEEDSNEQMEFPPEPEAEYGEEELLPITQNITRAIYYHDCQKYIGFPIRILTDNEEPCRFCGEKPKRKVY